MLNEIEKKAVGELIEKLKKTYGDSLVKVILYGSKARGDSTEDSDIDIMVVLKNFDKWENEFNKIFDIVYEVETKYDYEVLISFIIKSQIEFNISNMPLMLNVKDEGINLWMRE